MTKKESITRLVKPDGSIWYVLDEEEYDESGAGGSTHYEMSLSLLDSVFDELSSDIAMLDPEVAPLIAGVREDAENFALADPMRTAEDEIARLQVHVAQLEEEQIRLASELLLVGARASDAEQAAGRWRTLAITAGNKLDDVLGALPLPLPADVSKAFPNLNENDLGDAWRVVREVDAASR